jgi:hypothetical protein
MSTDTVEVWDVQATRDFPTTGGTHTPFGFLVEWETVATGVSERHHAEEHAKHHVTHHEYKAARLVHVLTTTVRTPDALSLVRRSP